MIGGFTNYAHLRLRDHRPGNGDYELPPTFGPDADSSKRSILGRHYAPQGGESCSDGPCAYDVPSTFGTGRGTRFASPLPSKTTTTAAAAPATGSSDKTTNVVAPPAEPKQYSMALCPDTPSYSLYGRLKAEWEQQSNYASPGPAAYAVRGYFDQLDPTQQPDRATRVAPGAHLGTRTDLPGTRERDGAPGPGTYDLVRFGDVVPRVLEPVLSRRRRPRGIHGGGATDTPGPGAYDDPSTIGYRAAQTRAKRLFAPSSTFGGRWKGREYHTVGPGPAAYNTVVAAKLLEKNQRHPPKFAATQPAVPSGSIGESGEKKPSEASSTHTALPLSTLPSDFDYDYTKGKSILGKWHVPAEQPRSAPVADTATARGGPAFWESPLPPGGRFAAGSYHSDALQAAETAAKAEAARAAEAARQQPGPGSYQAQSRLTERRSPAALFGHTSSAKFATADNGVPGPGHYRTVDDAGSPRSTTRGPVFYKGDFHPRSGYRRPSADEDNGGGPGAHYNDGTQYSRSINGDRAGSKGFTMGIRYPARATYQYCAPYDETTNINCVYPDEQTWETKPKLRLPPVHSAKE